MPASPARRLGLAYAAVLIGALGLVPPVAARMPARAETRESDLAVATPTVADVDASTLFLRKPFLPSDLLVRVRDALGDVGPAPSPSPSLRAAS